MWRQCGQTEMELGGGTKETLWRQAMRDFFFGGDTEIGNRIK